LKISKFIIVLLLILSACLLVPSVSAVQWKYNFSSSLGPIDLVNSTYMKDWMYYLIVTNNSHVNWDLPVIGFAADIMGPFTHAFKGIGDDSGNIVYLILFGLYIMMVWRQSGKTTIPAMMSVIVGGGWAMLMPESSWPWAMILLSVALASQLLTFFAKE
jgi:hypothetical protein